MDFPNNDVTNEAFKIMMNDWEKFLQSDQSQSAFDPFDVHQQQHQQHPVNTGFDESFELTEEALQNLDNIEISANQPGPSCVFDPCNVQQQQQQQHHPVNTDFNDSFELTEEVLQNLDDIEISANQPGPSWLYQSPPEWFKEIVPEGRIPDLDEIDEDGAIVGTSRWRDPQRRLADEDPVMDYTWPESWIRMNHKSPEPTPSTTPQMEREREIEYTSTSSEQLDEMDHELLQPTPPPPPPPQTDRERELEQSSEQPYDYFEIISRSDSEHPNFTSSKSNVVLRLIPHPHMDVKLYISAAFDEIINKIVKKGTSNNREKIGLSISNTNDHKPFGISLRPVTEIDKDIILANFEKLLQSNEEFMADAPIEVVVTRIRLPEGYRRDLESTDDAFCCNKRSIIQVSNDDNLCLPKALLLAKAHLERHLGQDEEKHFTQMKKNVRNMLTEAALDLIIAAGVDSDDVGGQDALNKFQQHLIGYKITVFNSRDGRRVIFDDENITANKYLDLYHYPNHYNVITSLKGAFGYTSGEYCRKCKNGTKNKGTHRCADGCKDCNNSTNCPEEARIKCNVCNRTFKGNRCFQNHKEIRYGKNKSVCDNVKHCTTCRVTYSVGNGKTGHICDKVHCRYCKKHVEPDHLCFIQQRKVKSKKGLDLYVFYDFECRQDTPDGEHPKRKIHIPNLCVLQKQCSKCSGEIEDVEANCSECGQRQILITREGNDLLGEFFEELEKTSKKFKNIFIYAHNASGYDAQFILKYMIEERKWAPEVILNGNKIMQIKFGKYHFKDTLNLFHVPLSALPKMFGIEETCKGYFPHYFNTVENQNYVGEIPDIKYYGANYMKPKQRLDFLNWWLEKKNEAAIFNFKREIRKYCVNDVDILRKSFLIFRKLYVEATGVDISSICTIASACMEAFRKCHLEKDIIGLIPHGGYRWKDRSSIEALRYFRYLEKKHGIKIQSADNGKEMKFGNYKVDGYTPDFLGKGPTIFEYYGCYYHGCEKCYPNRTINISRDSKIQTMSMLKESTDGRAQNLRNMGFNLEEIWACDFKNTIRNDREVNSIVREIKFIEPLNPRDAFFGGRTEVFKKYHKVKNHERICYLDVCSLCPFICKYGIFPINHPKIYYEDNVPESIRGMTGIAKIEILPPKNLYFPVLPIKTREKLIFGLCTKCVTSSNLENCNHSDEERMISGTFTCIEIDAAVDRGYKIKKIHEVWEYESTKYNPLTKEGGIYSSYINQFLKLKTEASGFPQDVISEEDKERYIKEYQEKEGITLDKDSIELNPGFRSLAKLCLNSLWGKGAQRGDLPQTTIINQPAKLYEMASNPSVEVSDVIFPAEDVAVISWNHATEDIPCPLFTNVVVAAHVTAGARLHLLKFLEMVGDRALYCDTDSIFYIQYPGAPDLLTGNFLGDLTDELSEYGVGSYISEFVAEGPKNYSYRVHTPSGDKEFTKVRGLTLDYKTCKTINFEAITAIVHGEEDLITVNYENKIQRKRNFKVVTAPMRKRYGGVPSKRRCLEEFKTLPYGYM